MDSSKPKAKRTRSYVEKVFQKVLEQPGIVDISILNKSGNPIKTTMERSVAIEYAGFYGSLAQKAVLGLQTVDPDDELKMLRVRTSLNEVLITPDEQITVMVIQNAPDKRSE